MEKQSKITCPECGAEIDVQDVLLHQVETKLSKEYKTKLAEEQKKFASKQSELEKAQQEFEAKKEKENELFQERLDKKIKEEKQQLKSKIKADLEKEQAEQLEELQKELNEKSQKISELNKSKAEIEKLKREKDELKEQIEAEAQKTINKKLEEERKKIQETEKEKNELVLKELQKQLDDQKKLTEEMKRKQEQGSMQMQGEVQELAIEEWLQNNYSLDNIEEIKKGARGADCLQTVNTREQLNCGTIYYESKRTKDFQPSWIEKFKNDIREKGADIGVLVTETMPKDMDRAGMKDGVWVCSFDDFKTISYILREQIIKINSAVSSQENKGDKMVILYDFLSSNEFRMQMEAIIEGFTQMKSDLDKERNAMQRIWKQREKQIEKVLTNTINMHGAIKGIAGNAIQTVQALELPYAEDEE